jgi:hypothetical protein
MPRRAPDRLDKRPFGAQEPFLVGVEDNDQRDFRQVEPLTQEVDPDDDIVDPEPEIAQDFHPFQRLDVVVEILGADTGFFQIVRQVLRHPLRQRRHQDALAFLDPCVGLGQEVIDLPGGRAHADLRVDQPGRADDLLHHPFAVLVLERPRRRRDVDHLPEMGHELVEHQRAVVERRGEAEAVIDQDLLAAAVAAVHPAHLRQRDVRLIDHHQVVVGEVIERVHGCSPARAARGGASSSRRRAVADLLQHL